MDLDLDHTVPMDEDSDQLHSISNVATDSVKWQASQTSCVALDNLITEVQKAQETVVLRRSPRFTRSRPWDSSGPSASSSSGSSTFPSATSTTSSLPTNTRTRPRPPRHSHPNLSDLTFAPTSSRSSTPNIFKKDPAQFLDLVKGVSERVDENANARRKNTAEGGDGQTKRTKRLDPATRDGVGVIRGLKENRRVSPGTVVAAGHRIAGKMKGKDKEVKANNTETNRTPIIAHRSLPSLSAPTSTSTMCVDSPPRPGSSTSQIPMDLDASFTMSMDVDSNSSDRPISLVSPLAPSARRTDMPPPAVPPFKIVSKPPSIPSSSSSMTAPPIQKPTPKPNPHPNPPIPPPPKYHPLIQQPPPPKSRPPKPQPQPQLQHSRTTRLPPPHISPPLSQNPRPAPPPARPPPSQSSTRPPPLGMRRAHTLPLDSPFTPSQTLPARQKGFKVPLLSQSQPQAPPRLTQPQPQPHATHLPNPRSHAKVQQPKLPTPAPTPSSSPQHQIPQTHRNEEPHHLSSPDSSFGDMSFDMDALEETMRKYD